jgi:hypothetical protein
MFGPPPFVSGRVFGDVIEMFPDEAEQVRRGRGRGAPTRTILVGAA